MVAAVRLYSTRAFAVLTYAFTHCSPLLMRQTALLYGSRGVAFVDGEGLT
jgi:hypothetical protein